jgi:hypothetical protein
MNRSPIEDIVTTLKMPLRDVAKTLRAATHASQEQLKGPSRLLPSPLRDLIKQSLDQADRLGGQLLERPAPSPAQLRQAREALLGAQSATQHRRALVKAISYALHAGLVRYDLEDWVISDVRLSMLASDWHASTSGCADEAVRVARFATMILTSHAVFSIQGLLPSKPASANEALTVATVAAFLWLWVERDPGEDEPLLLQLCMDVAASAQTDLAEAVHDPVELAACLERLARVV